MMIDEKIVLIVDDEPDVRRVLEMILHRRGYVVATACSGADALHWLTESGKNCQLILLDAKLGDCEGVELAKQIPVQTGCTAPVILVSGYFYKDDSLVQINLQEGVIAGFVTKPFRHDEILQAVRSVLMTG